MGGVGAKAPLARPWSAESQQKCSLISTSWKVMENTFQLFSELGNGGPRQLMLFTLQGTSRLYPTKRESREIIDSKVSFNWDMLVPWKVVTSHQSSNGSPKPQAEMTQIRGLSTGEMLM